jgi:peroxiredoxin Q/BCP
MKSYAVMVSVLGLSLAACTRPAVRPDGQVGPLPVGAVAPDVVGYDASHQKVELATLRGSPAIVYFYPKDGSPGCTKEACAFRDAWARFQTAKVGVIGVSSNSEERHQEFLKEKKLPFALAADESNSIARSYGVGSGIWGYDRITFLVDPNGKIAHVWLNVDPGVHANEVLAEASKLQQEE